MNATAEARPRLLARVWPWVRWPAVAAILMSTLRAESARNVAGKSAYDAGGTITIEAILEFNGPAPALGYAVDLPDGWSLLSTAGAAGDIAPPPGTTSRLEWVWTKQPASPVVFSYTVRVPQAAARTAIIRAEAILRQNHTVRTLPAAPLILQARAGG